MGRFLHGKLLTYLPAWTGNVYWGERYEARKGNLAAINNRECFLTPSTYRPLPARKFIPVDEEI